MWMNNNLNMHGASEIGPNVPAFLVKLWKLVEDSKCDLIKWSESGMSFIIVAQARFAREVLPLHYKHNNMASFIRQLNMYGFHKVSSLESGGLRHDKDEIEFAHQFFIKNHPYLLENIKRKMTHSKPGSGSAEGDLPTDAPRTATRSEILAKLLTDINDLKGKQETWDTRLNAMKRENEALWRELALFRQKHRKQEQIINRLIHFIVTMVQPSRKVPMPRRFPLMLNDTEEDNIPNVNGIGGNHGSPPGPTIHEIDGDIHGDVLIGGNEVNQPSGMENGDVLIGSNKVNEPSELGNKDVLIGGNEVNEPSELANGGFISATFPASANNIEVESDGLEVNKDPVISNLDPLAKKDNPSDWLEIVLTEDDMVTPLTPVDPTEVNPVVAAATLKHLETKNKITIPVTMKIPSIITSDGKKKTIPEKKIIYLAEIPKPERNIKKKQPKQPTPKNESNKNKGATRPKASTTVTISGDTNLASSGDKNATVSKILTIPAKKVVAGKRKLSQSNSPDASNIAGKRLNVEVKPVIEAASEHCSPFPTPNTLDNLLTYNLFDLEAIDSEENTTKKQSNTDEEDPFWKLESLYNGSFGDNDLITGDSQENSVVDNIEKDKVLTVKNNEKTAEIGSCDDNATEIESSKVPEKEEGKNKNRVTNFPPESLAVVPQSASSVNEELSRELSSHVDNVQGEIDYLKEVLKGEGYNLDMNNILGYFNEDPLSYGLLPPAEEEPKEKENDKGIAGNEVISYGTPNNLMELVDLFGSTGTVQDWSNISSPISPTVSELQTPASSPGPANGSKSGKNRK